MARGTGRRNQIAGQFAARRIDMLQSPAYRVLSRAAHQVLSRIEIEHAHHGGAENGVLPVTYEHFIEYGLHRRMIAPAIRELAALGFLEVTRRGSALNAHLCQSSMYRLTYRHAKGADGDGTHEWRNIRTLEEAEALARQARNEADDRARTLGLGRAKKQKASYTLCPVSVAQSGTENAEFPVTQSATTSPVTQSGTTSISRDAARPLADASAEPDRARYAPPTEPRANASRRPVASGRCESGSTTTPPGGAVMMMQHARMAPLLFAPPPLRSASLTHATASINHGWPGSVRWAAEIIGEALDGSAALARDICRPHRSGVARWRQGSHRDRPTGRRGQVGVAARRVHRAMIQRDLPFKPSTAQWRMKIAADERHSTRAMSRARTDADARPA
jgi:hypothetical protein